MVGESHKRTGDDGVFAAQARCRCLNSALQSSGVSLSVRVSVYVFNVCEFCLFVCERESAIKSESFRKKETDWPDEMHLAGVESFDDISICL
jgi:hypothetical protein